MKLFVAAATLLLALALVACGGGNGDSTDEELQARIDAYLSAPKPEIPNRPPPEKLVVKDVKAGDGPVAKRGDRITLHYIAYAWVTRELFSRRWEPDPPVVYPKLGDGQFPDLEKGLIGMREGGRREVTVPNYSELPAVIYLVDIEKVEPPAE